MEVWPYQRQCDTGLRGSQSLSLCLPLVDKDGSELLVTIPAPRLSACCCHTHLDDGHGFTLGN